MGATVTCAKKVCAMTTNAGVNLYLLVESIYEKNLHPHRPTWCAIAFGTIADVMRGIFLHGSSCEGGMLQTPHGHITPEGYIDGWLKELAAPRALSTPSIIIRASDLD